MKVKLNKFKLLFYSVIALSAIFSALRIISLLTVFEPDIGYYKADAIIPRIQQILAVCSVIFIIAFSSIIRKNETPIGRPFPTHFSNFASFLCGTLQICSSILILLFQRGSIAPVTIVIMLGFAFATVYFFYDALCPPEKKSPYSIFPAMAAIVGLIAIIVKIHLDYTVTLNNPNKTLIFISLAAISLYMVQELRFIVGKPQPRVYLATASIALILSSALSIPGIIGYYSNVLSGGDFLIYYMVTFGYCVYIFVRLFLYTGFCACSPILTEEQNDQTME